MDWMSSYHPAALIEEWEAIRAARRAARADSACAARMRDRPISTRSASVRDGEKLRDVFRFMDDIADALQSHDRVHTYAGLRDRRCPGLTRCAAISPCCSACCAACRARESHAEALSAFYAPQAHHYDRFRERLLRGRAELIERLPLADGARVVELGGGTGRNAEFFGAKLDRIEIADDRRRLRAAARAGTRTRAKDSATSRHRSRCDDVRAGRAGRRRLFLVCADDDSAIGALRSRMRSRC